MTAIELIRKIYGVDTELSTRASVLLRMMRAMPNDREQFKDTFEYKKITEQNLLSLFCNRGDRKLLLSELISLTSKI